MPKMALSANFSYKTLDKRENLVYNYGVIEAELPFSPAQSQLRRVNTKPVNQGDVVVWTVVPRFFYVNKMEVLVISNTKETSINEEIRLPEVRVIAGDGEQIGIMSSADALRIAEEKDLDLVLIAPQAKPPVCKIMDYGKYKFEQAKSEKKAKKNQKVLETKEIRMSLNIDTHDFETKLNQTIKFLKAGNKVKVSVRFRRARELSHQDLAHDLLNKFKEGLMEFGQVDKGAKLEGRNLAMIVTPKVQ